MRVFKRVFKYLSPTALCVAQERVHEAKPQGAAARAAIRELRRYWIVLLVLPKGNIYIRQCLTLAGLAYAGWSPEISDRQRRALQSCAVTMLARAKGAMHAATHDPATGDEELPFIEGAEYLDYTARAAEYADSQTNLLPLASELNSQRQIFSQMAHPDGWCATTDTRRAFHVAPSAEEAVHCSAFSVFRARGEFLLVHHDRRVFRLRHRMNLHVENTYGVTVRRPEDFPFWYPAGGWPDKRVSVLWRIIPSFTVWEYGIVRGHIARRHRFTGECQFILWKAGEQGHKTDYWHRLGDGWAEEFIA